MAEWSATLYAQRARQLGSRSPLQDPEQRESENDDIPHPTPREGEGAWLIFCPFFVFFRECAERQQCWAGVP